jgi:signal transduction histidine kinase/heme-degrading monooxygenase HmoA
MILAVSRFRVANGLEQDVTAAFADRPRLVDAWPGFLGMETFTETSDVTMFLLVTRWTDRGSFHSWHGSTAHRDSHKWMPKGLRLDPSCTQLVEWDRIPAGGAPDATAVAMDGVAAMGAYLDQTRVVHMVRIALTGEIEMMNAAMASHLGLARAPVGGSLFEYLTESDGALVRERLSAPSNAPNPVNLNYCDARGEPFTLSSHLTVYPDGCLAIAEPVYADEQQLQRQLVELNEELAGLARQRQRSVVSEQRARQLAEADNRDKDEGLVVIAHELRQPLNSAMAALGVLKRSTVGAEPAVQILDRQVAYMAKLVEDLLNASQVMRGVVTLNREPANLARLVRDAAESIEPAVRERRQRMTIEEPVAPVQVSVDLDRMRQVLVNILSNAMKYTPLDGSIDISVEQTSEAGCRVSVRDTGQGMSPETLGRVFDLFVRGTTGGNGLGIGLAVAKRLVELHGGVLVAQSEGVGRGSAFTVTLPLLAPTSVGSEALLDASA